MERAIAGTGVLQICNSATVNTQAQTQTPRRVLGFAAKNSLSLVLNRRATTGAMAAAAVESSPTTPAAPRGFYQRFRDALPFLAVTKDTRETIAAETEDKPREDADRMRIESPSGLQETPKAEKPNKKKKPIVSSSTVVPRVEVCIGKKCKARGSEALLSEFQTASNGRVEMAYTKCMHECKKGMNTRVTKDGTTFVWHHEVSKSDVEPILCKHFDW